MHQNIGLLSTIVRNDCLLTTDLDGETAMMDKDQGKYYALDQVGSRIWPLIEKPTKVVEILNCLLRHYSVDRLQCEHDLLAFLNDLETEKLIWVIDDDDNQ